MSPRAMMGCVCIHADGGMIYITNYVYYYKSIKSIIHQHITHEEDGDSHIENRTEMEIFLWHGEKAKALYIMHKVMENRKFILHYVITIYRAYIFHLFREKKKKKKKYYTLTDAFLNQNIYHRNNQKTSP